MLLVLCTSQFSALVFWYLVSLTALIPHLDSLSFFKILFWNNEPNAKKCAFGVRNLWWVVLNFSAFLSFFLGFLDLLVPLFCYLSLQEMLLHCSSSWLQCMYHLRTPFGSYKSANFWSFFNSFLLKGVVLFDSWTCFYNLFYSLLAFILYIYLINLTDIFYYWEVVNLC